MLRLLLVIGFNFCASSDPEKYQLSENAHVNEYRGYFKREHSFSKPYQSSSVSDFKWDMVGNTIMTKDSIRLTPDLKSMTGGVWNSVPVHAPYWECIVTLKIHGTTGDLYGDGLAFWYVKDRGAYGQPTDVFGYKNMFTGLGIFIDTYSNHNGPHNHVHPYISAMVGNGSVKYDHDIDGTHTQLGNDGCNARLRNKDHDTNLLIRYVDDTISVYTDISDEGVWKKCLLVRGVKLPTGYYFGLTAATGDLSDAHELIAVKMFEIDVPIINQEQRAQIIPGAEYFAAPRDHIASTKPSRLSGVGATILVIICLVGLAAVVIVGVFVLQKRQESSRKRFY